MFFRRVAPALALVALGALGAFGSGCSTPPRLSADQYYTEGKDPFGDKNYEGAIRNYKELLDQYPFDPHAEEAELTIAESHYKKKQYAEAIAAFNDFQRMHPMSPELREGLLPARQELRQTNDDDRSRPVRRRQRAGLVPRRRRPLSAERVRAEGAPSHGALPRVDGASTTATSPASTSSTTTCARARTA